MYLARKVKNSRTRYIIRESYRVGSVLKSRDLFDLGTDPSQYIIYPGGNGYYFDEAVEEALRKKGLEPTQDDLDPIFYDFLDPEIQRVIQGFERKSQKQRSGASRATQSYHLFDMRRIHFLRFGSTRKPQLDRAPKKFFRVLRGKSRDEIEQHFMVAERVLHPREWLRYLLTIFNLMPCLADAGANRADEETPREKMDTRFIESICELDKDEAFWAGMSREAGLQMYLRRYAILYFDHALQWRPAMPGYLHEFIHRHRVYRPPKKVRLNMAEASRLFETTWENLKKMDSKSFTRLYRKQALKMHPDQGGSQDRFVKLTRLYEKLLKKKGR